MDYLCGSIRGVEIKDCEAMLGLFLSGKFTYSSGPRINEGLLRQVDWTKPSQFSKRGEAISAGFPHKGGPGSGFFDMEVEFVGGKLKINQMFQAIPKSNTQCIRNDRFLTNILPSSYTEFSEII